MRVRALVRPLVPVVNCESNRAETAVVFDRSDEPVTRVEDVLCDPEVVAAITRIAARWVVGFRSGSGS